MSGIKGRSPNAYVLKPIHRCRTRSSGVKIRVKVQKVADKVRYKNGLFFFFFKN